VKKHILFVLILLLLTLVLNAPIILKPTVTIPSFFTIEEPYSAIWTFWRMQYSHNNHLSLNFTTLINYPFGLNLFFSGYCPYIWMKLNYLLAVITTPALTYNIQVLMNFFLSALFIYLLVFFLTKIRLVSFFSGIIFSFSPQHFGRAWQHLGLTYFEWIPLILLSAILLKEMQVKKKMFLFGLSIVLLFSFDYSIMYLGMVSLAAFLTYVFSYNWWIKFFENRKLIKNDIRYFKKTFIVGAVAFLILLPHLMPTILNYFNPPKMEVSAYNSYHRPFEDLFNQSAKPLGYLLPSTEHTIFGDFTKKFVGSPLWGVSYTEHQLYLGWTTILLALYAIRIWRRRRRLKVKSKKLKVKGKNYEQEIRDDFYIGFFIFLAIVAWLFSQPPWWQMGKFKILMPSFFMYKILPMFRAYCRFGIVVLLAMAVLAGYGLKYVSEKVKSKKLKAAIPLLFCGLILFEFWNNPFTHYIDLSKYPAVYDWLKTQPEDVVIAEYPMIKDGVNEKYKFYQTVHHKKLINGVVPGIPGYQVKLAILDLGAKKTPFILKYLGAEYAIVHTKKYEQSEDFAMYNQLKKIRNNPDLQLVETFDDGIEVYKIK